MTAQMPTEQLDLFVDYDELARKKEQQEREARLEREPAVCPCCGKRESSGWHLYLNHGISAVDGTIGGWAPEDHPNYRGRCEAQCLTANHIHYYVLNDREQELEEEIAYGRTLANFDVDAIVAQARRDKEAEQAQA